MTKVPRIQNTLCLGDEKIGKFSNFGLRELGSKPNEKTEKKNHSAKGQSIRRELNQVVGWKTSFFKVSLENLLKKNCIKT